MRHQDLKDMGMTSVGHRLTLLKGVYDCKVKQNIAFDQDHYVPLCEYRTCPTLSPMLIIKAAEGNADDMAATQDDIAKVIDSIRLLRDQRIAVAEAELRVIKEDLHRVLDENRKLREETLPMIRMAKDRSQPLPNPEQPPLAPAPAPVDFKADKGGSSLSRKFSTKRLFLGSAPKNTSPTISAPQQLQDAASIDPLPVPSALASSSHLAASSLIQNSPNQLPQLSPTSPAYTIRSPAPPSSSRGFLRSDTTSSSRIPQQQQSSQHDDHARHSYNNSSHWSSATLVDRSTSNTSARRVLPSSTASDTDPPTPATLTPSTSTIPSTSSYRPDRPDRDRSDRTSDRTASSSSRDNIEIFKSFRVSVDDPCHKVLPVALQRYKINDDWRQFDLVIVYGDQERSLGLDEKPLLIFKQLDREGRKPMFMLRKHGTVSADGRGAGAVGAGGAAGVAVPAGGAAGLGLGAGVDRGLPGGVL